jgi:hypothetical protein
MASHHTLHFRRLWQRIGWGLVGMVVWLSLTPHPPEPPVFPVWDKAQHALAYACLMLWFRQAFSSRWHWPVFFLLLGTGLEFLQDLGGVRTFDPSDMLANSLGVCFGWILGRTPLGRMLAGIDRLLAEAKAN